MLLPSYSALGIASTDHKCITIRIVGVPMRHRKPFRQGKTSITDEKSGTRRRNITLDTSQNFPELYTEKSEGSREHRNYKIHLSQYKLSNSLSTHKFDALFNLIDASKKVKVAFNKLDIR